MTSDTRTSTIQLINCTQWEVERIGDPVALHGKYTSTPSATISGDPGYSQWEMESGSATYGSSGTVTYHVPYVSGDGKPGARVEIRWLCPYVGPNRVEPVSSCPDRIKFDVSKYSESGDLAVVIGVYDSEAPPNTK
ncbi:hypothetical protein B0H13DRAFT_2361304 [Mycena leptocephala]|nr:hypothetical protein B0H13DRAFT_2361304 [Mycena leptocephala]